MTAPRSRDPFTGVLDARLEPSSPTAAREMLLADCAHRLRALLPDSLDTLARRVKRGAFEAARLVIRLARLDRCQSK